MTPKGHPGPGPLRHALRFDAGVPNELGLWCVSRGMGDYGPATPQVRQLLERVARITIDDAVDLYEARVARILIHGPQAEREALHRALRAAKSAGLEREYIQARHDAANVWRNALPEAQGPWLLVGQAISNAAGAWVMYTALSDKQFQALIGPCRVALGCMEPVGPGISMLAGARAR